ncbi:hypothetical protein J6590_094125, partial [Homalodisca vitripennis]
MCTKLQLKSPLKSDLCLAVTLNEPSLLDHKTDTALKKLKSALEILYRSNWIK